MKPTVHLPHPSKPGLPSVVWLLRCPGKTTCQACRDLLAAFGPTPTNSR